MDTKEINTKDNNIKQINPQGLSPLKIWYLAIRPKTLPAAAGPVFVGIGLAKATGFFGLVPEPQLLALCSFRLIESGQ
jgi:1,4-dihydroxy-2-naphthoate octaprenyltransferase